MSNFEEERQVKQSYLKEKIIDAGYSGANFQTYVCAIKPDGDNIDVWTLAELKNIVQNFITQENKLGNVAEQLSKSSVYVSEATKKATTETKTNKNSAEEEKKNNVPVVNKNNPFESKPAPVKNTEKIKEQKEEIKEQKTEEILKSKTETIPKSNLDPSPTKSMAELDKTVPSVNTAHGLIHVGKMNSTPLSEEKNVIIKVGNPQQASGGLLSGSYLTYQIKTHPFEWIVTRRYNDFYWLRGVLVKLHPGIFIPPIPKKKRKNRFEPESVRQRMYFFEHFLNACMQNKDLKADHYLHQFLSVTENDKFQSLQRAGNQAPKIDRIEKMSTFSGEVYLDMSREYLQQTNLANDYCKDTAPIYKKIRKLTKLLVHNMKYSSNIVLEMSKWFSQLEGVSNKHYDRFAELNKDLKFENFFSSVTKMMEDWSNQLRDQATNIFKGFFCFYKYTSAENEIFREMAKDRARFELDCRKVERELTAKKEKLFQQGDMSNWHVNEDLVRQFPRNKIMEDKNIAFQVMLGEETKAVRYQNDMLAYINVSVPTETMRGLNYQGTLFKKSFQEFLKKQIEHASNLQNNWSNIMFSQKNRGN